MKTVILQRNAYGKGRHRFHPTFADFAKHCGFSIRMCRPYRARTKGKVERFNHYLRYSFHKPLVVKLKMLGVSLISKELANGEVSRWLEEVANQRVHQEMLQRPCDLLKEEREAFSPLPSSYVGVRPSLMQTEASTTPPVDASRHTIEIPTRDLALYDRFIPKSLFLVSLMLMEQRWLGAAS